MTAFVAHDVITLVTPLGLRFRDAATGRVVGDGLDVRHTPAGGGRPRIATVGPSGVWSLSGLPGLRELESGAGDQAYWDQVPALARTFEVTVEDLARRYLPLRLSALAPFRELFAPVCGSPLMSPVSPPSSDDHVPLFRAPACPAPPGYGTVRADLREPSGTPAAWAVLVVRPDGGAAALGMADDQGRVAVPVSYPGPSGTTVSPLPGSQRSFAAERWRLTVECRYDRTCPPDRPPDLCAALDQAPAALDLESASPELPYGRDLVLKSSSRSELVVTAAASPL